MADVTPIKPRLLPKNFGEASFGHRRWYADLSESNTLADAMQPYFWVDAVDKLSGHDSNYTRAIGDIIEVRKLDSGLYAELIVREIGKGFIKVDQLRMAEPEAVIVPEGPLEPKWNVGKRCWEVIRKDNKQQMFTGYQTKAKAVEAITDHMKAMAA